ncbi:unnamed protein product [Rotaria sordida]|uniref:NHL repeat containing protein n=1 Tax=Rotaria sordida TaxID=392033 RepID=A0A818Z9Z9_9BILA|nr:unnamed protein product [Rotaria sordida]
MRIAYPRRCGVAPACKQRFLNNVLTLFNTFTSSFPATFIFANGRSVQLVLYPCRATGAFPFIVGGAGGARITTTTRAPVCSLQWNPAGTTVAGDGTAGVGAQQLNLPTDVFLASANTLFIVCTGASRVQRWTIGATQGVTVAGQADGSAGGNPNQLSNPTGVVVDRNGNIYVTDTVPGRIQLWPPGAAAGQTIAAGLNGPSGIAYDGNLNRLFVVETGNNRVIQYILANPVTSSVVAGTNVVPPANNPLNGPTGISFDPASNSLLIANSGANSIIQWFLTTNTFALVAGDSNGAAADGLNRLNSPRGVIWDPNGNIIVADTGNRRVILFPPGQTDGTKNGRIIAGTGVAGNNNNQLNNPYAVRLDNQGNLLVVDSFNSRIQMFTCIQI